MKTAKPDVQFVTCLVEVLMRREGLVRISARKAGRRLGGLRSGKGLATSPARSITPTAALGDSRVRSGRVSHRSECSAE